MSAGPRRESRPFIPSGVMSFAGSQPSGRNTPIAAYVFATERGTPFTPDAINPLVKTIGQRAGLPLPVHFHMLRHSCGYKLANDGIDTRAIQDWLGHVSITHTTRYTQLSQARFKDFWRD
jgi:type 1 fimbriae regulatory protein FimB/type 1 fimbriae regulatory protein FimE